MPSTVPERPAIHQKEVLLVLSISQLLWLRVVGLIGTPFVERVWQAVDKHPTQT